MPRRVPRRVPLVVALVAAVALAGLATLAGCGGPDGDPMGPPASRAPARSANDVLSALEAEDGTVSTQHALEAFAATVGPVPGVTPLELPAPVGDEWVSGDRAIGWVAQHLDDLDDAQRQAVAAVLDAPDPPRQGRSAAPATRPAPEWSDWATAARQFYEARTGWALGLHLDVRRATGTFVGRTTAFATTNAVFDGPARDDDTGASAGPDTCLIQVAEGADGRSSRSKQGIIAHEVFHCFQLDVMGSQSRLDGTPSWFHEGLAAWAGEQPFGASGNADNWYATYFTGDGNGRWRLDRASYDAIGWLSSMEASGVQLWSAVQRMFASPDADPVTGLQSDGALTAALGQLGPSSSRRADLGGRWTPVGAGASATTAARHIGLTDAAPTATIESGSGNVVTAVAPGPGAVVMRMGGSGNGSWAWGGIGHDIGPGMGAEGKWCFLDPCVCPGPDREPIPGGPYDAAPAGDPLTIGLAGLGNDLTSQVVVAIQTLDELCRPRTTTSTTAPPGSGVRAAVSGLGAGSFGGGNGPTDYCTADMSGGLWLLNIGTPGNAEFAITADQPPTGPGRVMGSVMWNRSTISIGRAEIVFDPGLRSGSFSGPAIEALDAGFNTGEARGTFDCGDGGHPIGGARPWRGG